MAAVTVKPGKYAPVGNRSEPTKVAQPGADRRPAGAVEHAADHHRGKAEADLRQRHVKRKNAREYYVEGDEHCAYRNFFRAYFHWHLSDQCRSPTAELPAENTAIALTDMWKNMLVQIEPERS